MKNKKGPRYIGVKPNPNDPTVREYRRGVQDRAKAQRQEKPGVGNLAQAQSIFNPAKDGPMTIQNIVEGQKNMEGRDRSEGSLSPETIEVMKATAKETMAQRERKEAAVEPQAAPPEKVAEEPRRDPPPSTNQRSAMEELNNLDEFDLERLMRSVQQDVINNKREQEAVRSRCSEVDIAESISTGSFEQTVDIAPGRLKVVFRTLSTQEHHEIRAWILDKVMGDKTGKTEKMAAEIYGLATVVASVVQINTKAYPSHMKGAAYDKTFDVECFENKYKTFLSMPMPLIHAIGTHGGWFDIRMRELFTTESIKNG